MPWKNPKDHRDKLNAACRRWRANHRAESREGARLYRKRNLDRVAAYMRAYRKQNPALMAAIDKKRIFGLVPDEIAMLLTAQGNRCAVCNTAEPGKLGWCVDHNHATGAVRGMLCAACNKGIGFFRDNPEAMRNAAVYVETEPAQERLAKYRAKQPQQMKLAVVK